MTSSFFGVALYVLVRMWLFNLALEFIQHASSIINDVWRNLWFEGLLRGKHRPRSSLRLEQGLTLTDMQLPADVVRRIRTCFATYNDLIHWQTTSKGWAQSMQCSFTDGERFRACVIINFCGDPGETVRCSTKTRIKDENVDHGTVSIYVNGEWIDNGQPLAFAIDSTKRTYSFRKGPFRGKYINRGKFRKNEDVENLERDCDRVFKSPQVGFDFTPQGQIDDALPLEFWFIDTKRHEVRCAQHNNVVFEVTAGSGKKLWATATAPFQRIIGQKPRSSNPETYLQICCPNEDSLKIVKTNDFTVRASEHDPRCDRCQKAIQIIMYRCQCGGTSLCRETHVLCQRCYGDAMTKICTAFKMLQAKLVDANKESNNTLPRCNKGHILYRCQGKENPCDTCQRIGTSWCCLHGMLRMEETLEDAKDVFNTGCDYDLCLTCYRNEHSVLSHHAANRC